MRLHPEQAESILLMDWIRMQPKIANYTFHIGNERKTSLIQGSLLKRMGIRAGVSDYFIAVPVGIYHGLFLELKVGKNKPTPAQIQFLKHMNENNYFSTWCTGFDEAKLIIELYIKGSEITEFVFKLST